MDCTNTITVTKHEYSKQVRVIAIHVLKFFFFPKEENIE